MSYGGRCADVCLDTAEFRGILVGGIRARWRLFKDMLILYKWSCLRNKDDSKKTLKYSCNLRWTHKAGRGERSASV